MSSWLIISLTAVVTCLATLAIDFIVRQFGKREKHVERKIEHLYAAGDDQFVRSMANLLTGPFREGNCVTPLRNGNEIFPAMLAAIRGARSTITFETFIYWAGDIGGEFAQALAERGRQHRLHRRGGHRGRVDRRRAGRRRLAGLALPYRGSLRRGVAERVHGQLDQGERRRPAR